MDIKSNSIYNIGLHDNKSNSNYDNGTSKLSNKDSKVDSSKYVDISIDKRFSFGGGNNEMGSFIENINDNDIDLESDKMSNVVGTVSKEIEENKDKNKMKDIEALDNLEYNLNKVIGINNNNNANAVSTSNYEGENEAYVGINSTDKNNYLETKKDEFDQKMEKLNNKFDKLLEKNKNIDKSNAPIPVSNNEEFFPEKNGYIVAKKPLGKSGRPLRLSKRISELIKKVDDHRLCMFFTIIFYYLSYLIL